MPYNRDSRYGWLNCAFCGWGRFNKNRLSYCSQCKKVTFWEYWKDNAKANKENEPGTMFGPNGSIIDAPRNASDRNIINGFRRGP